MELLRLENVGKSYGEGDSKVQAVKKINLSINKGEIIAIIGTSGSGKSTLLNIIGLLESMDFGDYYIEGKNIKEYSEKEIAKLRNKTFGFIVQHFALIKDFTVYENIEVPLSYNREINKKEIPNKIEDVLYKMKIREKINAMPSSLSGGQCQRVAIARALVNDTDIILADEPTGSLDKKTGIEIINIFKELNREGKTIIIVTHDESIANECEKIIRIEDGEIISE